MEKIRIPSPVRAVLGRCWVAATLDQNREWHKTGATFVIGTVFDFKGGDPCWWLGT